MKRENFTVSRIDAFRCQPNTKQTIYWGEKAPGLGLRVTSAGARAEAARMKTLVNEGKDPRMPSVGQRIAREAREREKQRQVVTMGAAWDKYVSARKAQWSERTYLPN